MADTIHLGYRPTDVKSLGFRPMPPQLSSVLGNRKGEFAELPKHDLKIDDAYQRILNHHVVRRIASDWQWIGCGCLLVSLRPSGDFYVFDGGHRLEAAKKLPNLNLLPCMVYELSDVMDEARGFIKANLEKRSMNRLASYKAELLVEAPGAILIDELARQAGRNVGSRSPKTGLRCVAAIERTAGQDIEALRRVWPVIVEACRDCTISSIFVIAIWAAERRMPYGQSLTDPRWRQRIVKTGVQVIEQAIRQQIVLAGGRSDMALSQGVLMAINRSIRGSTARLELRDKPTR